MGLGMRDEAWLASRAALAHAADQRLARSQRLGVHTQTHHNACTTNAQTPSGSDRGAPATANSDRGAQQGQRSGGWTDAAAAATVRRDEERREALTRQLERERKLREDAEGALQWLTMQVKRAGVTAAIAAGAPGTDKTRALAVPDAGPDAAGPKKEGLGTERFTRSLLTREEAEAAVEEVKEEAERRVRKAEDELLEHLAAASIQRHCRAWRNRKALVGLGQRVVFASRRAAEALAENEVLKESVAQATQAREVAERQCEDARISAQESALLVQQMEKFLQQDMKSAADDYKVSPLSQAVAHMARRAAANAVDEARKAKEGQLVSEVAEAEARRAASGAERMARQRGSMVHAERTMREEAERRELDNAMRLSTLELRWQQGVTRRVQRVRSANHFNVWADYVRSAHRKQALMARGVAQMRRGVVAATFQEWATNVEHMTLVRTWEHAKLSLEAVALLMEAHGMASKGSGMSLAAKLGIAFQRQPVRSGHNQLRRMQSVPSGSEALMTRHDHSWNELDAQQRAMTLVAQEKSLFAEIDPDQGRKIEDVISPLPDPMTEGSSVEMKTSQTQHSSQDVDADTDISNTPVPKSFKLDLRLCCLSENVSGRHALTFTVLSTTLISDILSTVQAIVGSAPDATEPDNLVSNGKSLLAARGITCADCGLVDGQVVFFIGRARRPPGPIPGLQDISTGQGSQQQAAGEQDEADKDAGADTSVSFGSTASFDTTSLVEDLLPSAVSSTQNNNSENDADADTIISLGSTVSYDTTSLVESSTPNNSENDADADTIISSGSTASFDTTLVVESSTQNNSDDDADADTVISLGSTASFDTTSFVEELPTGAKADAQFTAEGGVGQSMALSSVTSSHSASERHRIYWRVEIDQHAMDRTNYVANTDMFANEHRVSDRASITDYRWKLRIIAVAADGNANNGRPDCQNHAKEAADAEATADDGLFPHGGEVLAAQKEQEETKPWSVHAQKFLRDADVSAPNAVFAEDPQIGVGTTEQVHITPALPVAAEEAADAEAAMDGGLLVQDDGVISAQGETKPWSLRVEKFLGDAAVSPPNAVFAEDPQIGVGATEQVAPVSNLSTLGIVDEVGERQKAAAAVSKKRRDAKRRAKAQAAAAGNVGKPKPELQPQPELKQKLEPQPEPESLSKGEIVPAGLQPTSVRESVTCQSEASDSSGSTLQESKDIDFRKMNNTKKNKDKRKRKEEDVNKKYEGRYPTAIVTHAFEGEVDGDLRLAVGDVVMLLKAPAGQPWWKGFVLDATTRKKRKGVFPSSFVRLDGGDDDDGETIMNTTPDKPLIAAVSIPEVNIAGGENDDDRMQEPSQIEMVVAAAAKVSTEATKGNGNAERIETEDEEEDKRRQRAKEMEELAAMLAEVDGDSSGAELDGGQREQQQNFEEENHVSPAISAVAAEWSITEVEAAKYAAFFDPDHKPKAGAGAFAMSGKKCMSVFCQSGLDNDVLGKVLEIATACPTDAEDFEALGTLEKPEDSLLAHEYLIAMHIIARYRSGVDKELPTQISVDMVRAAKSVLGL